MCADMCKSVTTYAAFCVLTALLMTGAAGSAQASRPYEEEKPRRSRFSLLRPARSNPETQLQYADHLLEKNRHRGARRQYRALVRYWPHSREAARAQLQYARLLEDWGRESRAFEEYEKLIRSYAGLFPYNEVLERQFHIAAEHLEERRGRFLFFRKTATPERAIPKFESLLENAPQWNRAPKVQYLLGRAHEMSRRYELAAHAYETVEARYPRSEFVEDASFGRARVLYRIAREQRNYDRAAETALIALNMFLRAYPESEHRDEALAYRETLTTQRARIAWKKADYYDRIARRPRAALMAYEMLMQDFPQSEWHVFAESRAAEIRSILEKDNP